MPNQTRKEKNRAIIVIPFLNEEKSLINTCQSLGFGLNTNEIPKDSMLLLMGSLNPSERVWAILEALTADKIICWTTIYSNSSLAD